MTHCRPHCRLRWLCRCSGAAAAAAAAGWGLRSHCLDTAWLVPPPGPPTPSTGPTHCPSGLWGAPLQHLLDDADVLEELIMLLDPEGKAGGGTRHLAARYGLSATWIDYAYSLRSTRSPLRATLETVAARQPDATLGQLAGLLAAMGRKDALQVLEGVQVGV
uniref:Death domain-containing protein n=1 Tax=Terrapene triunguis TaxID=2587831 RepID=A0A674J759_9SAUR